MLCEAAVPPHPQDDEHGDDPGQDEVGGLLDPGPVEAVQVLEADLAAGEAVDDDDSEGGYRGQVSRPLLAGADITLAADDEESDHCAQGVERVEDASLVFSRKQCSCDNLEAVVDEGFILGTGSPHDSVLGMQLVHLVRSDGFATGVIRHLSSAHLKPERVLMRPEIVLRSWHSPGSLGET